MISLVCEIKSLLRSRVLAFYGLHSVSALNSNISTANSLRIQGTRIFLPCHCANERQIEFRLIPTGDYSKLLLSP